MLNYNSSSNVSSAWTTTGNASTSPSTNFIGTTDAQSLVVKTNGTERLRVLSTGNMGIGTPTPSGTLHNAGSTVLGMTTASNTAATYTPAAEFSVNAYSGLVLTQTTTAAAVTLPSPTNTATGRVFTLTNSSASTHTVTVGNKTIPPSNSCVFTWDAASSSWFTAPTSSTTMFASFSTAQVLTETYYGYTLSFDASSGNLVKHTTNSRGSCRAVYRTVQGRQHEQCALVYRHRWPNCWKQQLAIPF